MSDEKSGEFGDKAEQSSASPSNSGEFGDFTEVKDEVIKKPVVNKGSNAKGKPKNKSKPNKGYKDKGEEEQQFTRLKRAKEGQHIGLVIQRLGGNRMEVSCNDGITRNARVPGRFRRKFWIRPGDAVIVEPWPDDDNKADIVFQYRKGEVNKLKREGMLDGVDDGF